MLFVHFTPTTKGTPDVQKHTHWTDAHAEKIPKHIIIYHFYSQIFKVTKPHLNFSPIYLILDTAVQFDRSQATL